MPREEEEHEMQSYWRWDALYESMQRAAVKCNLLNATLQAWFQWKILANPCIACVPNLSRHGHAAH